MAPGLLAPTKPLWIPRFPPLPARVRQGLVGWWDLSEASLIRVDKSGNGNSLTDNNTVTGNPGPSGNIPLASQFTLANSESLSILDNPTLSMSPGVKQTLCAWVFMDSAPITSMRIFQKGVSATNQRAYILEWDTTTNRFRYFVSNDGTNVPVVTADLFGVPSISTWYFVVGWYDGSFINISVNDGGINSLTHSLDIFDDTGPVYIGARGEATPDNFWNGRIAAVGIWKRALSAAERSYLYNGGAGRLLF